MPDARLTTADISGMVQETSRLIAARTPMVVFDLETTGLSSINDRILTISAMIVRWNGGFPEIERTFDKMINPGIPIPPSVTMVNGITDDMVKNCPEEKDVFPEIRAFIGDQPFLCGYNSVRFDQKFMEQLYARYGAVFRPYCHMDILPLAKHVLDLKSYKLIDVSHELGVDAGLTFHRSIDDVYASFRCLTILMKMYKKVQASGKKPLRVIKYRWWEGPIYYLQRIYLTTDPDTQTYYNVTKKEWRCSDPDVDLNAVRRNALALAGVKNETEFAAKARKEYNDMLELQNTMQSEPAGEVSGV